MTARLLDGRTVARAIRDEVATDLAAFRAAGGPQPHLAVLQVGDEPAASAYVRSIVRACDGAGMACTVAPLPADVGPTAVLALAETAAEITNRNALGDVATSAFLAEGAMRAAAVQGELNLGSIADTAFVEAMGAELGPSAAGAADRLAAILTIVRRRAGERP